MISIRRAVLSLMSVAMIVMVLGIITPFLSGDLDRYQADQVTMAKEHLAEILDVRPESIETLSGSSSPYRYGSFEVKFAVNQQQYTVIHENTWWRQLLGLRGQLSLD